ncbi:hypothetical protein [Halomonas sp. BC2]|uniref:hypothetical protein n=1 Tax=Halomonas sp. BC2 TaxID=1670449 RepID=UPI0009C182B9|nr:hypothetical protein [Halomonas sp. BC2]
MTMVVTGAAPGEVGPKMDGINETLVASIYEVDHHGEKLYENGAVLRCLFVDDANLEATFNWQSPFESAGAGGLTPTLSAMLQSGMIQPVVESVRGMLSSEERKKFDRSTPGGWADRTAGAVEHARGRTGITKLNSTQVFTGMAPIKLTVNIMLRAWQDPEAEVEDAINLLMDWALPRHLAAEGTLLTAALDWAGSNNRTAESLVEAALPSEVPALLAIQYKKRTFAPLVIESIGIPLNSPSDHHGRFVQLQIPVTFSTLTAWDGASWEGAQPPNGF